MKLILQNDLISLQKQEIDLQKKIDIISQIIQIDFKQIFTYYINLKNRAKNYPFNEINEFCTKFEKIMSQCLKDIDNQKIEYKKKLDNVKNLIIQEKGK